MELRDTLVRLGLALLLAVPIGWQRESEQKPAGLRTHLLVSLGCCLFTVAGLVLARGNPQIDPSRLASQVVTGIGFLGGGVIFRTAGSVRGLTTAASVWVTASIGLACGVGFFQGAAVVSIIAFFVLAAVGHWEGRYLRRHKKVAFVARYGDQEAARRGMEQLQDLGFRSEELSVSTEGGRIELRFAGKASPDAVSHAYRRLAADPGFLSMGRLDE
jgi:putative Mg2+ transporter-C (MgtC) family protein